MDNEKFLNICQDEVENYFNSLENNKDHELIKDDIYVVWLCKTLQNNKALLSTSVSDGMYYEITYNGDKNEIYFDAYKKVLNKAIKL